MTDVAAFVAFARHAEKRGYICCLDGVVHNALPFINFRRVQVPFVKLTWDAAIADLDAGAMDELRSGIAECNPERIILTRCGEKQAIEFGQSIGIALFQGWYPDRNGPG